MVRRYTNAATVYRTELDLAQHNISDFRLDQKLKNGPFSYDPVHPFRRLTPPHQNAKLVLTKTHCHGAGISTAFSSSPDDTTVGYIDDFCRRKGAFGQHLVHGIVHIARDPFDNIVARMHYETKNNRTGKDFTADGFREWCAALNDEAFERLEKRRNDNDSSNGDSGNSGNSRRMLSDSMTALLKRIPCASLFHQYFRWHEGAMAVAQRYQNAYNNNSDTSASTELPVLRFYYEDYATEWNKTSSAVLDFLGVSPAGIEPAPFIPGKTYHHFYTHDEKQAVTELFRKIATPDVARFLGRYFEQQQQQQQ